MRDQRSTKANPPTVEPELQPVHEQAMADIERLALDDLFSAAFEELKRLAISAKRSRVNPAVSTGTLINAAWLKLAGARRFAPESKDHFMNIAAKVMRHILIEAARRRSAGKRGGGDLSVYVTFDPEGLPISSGRDMLSLDAALNEMERLSPRHAKIVEDRFFGGFDEAEIAAGLKISPSTVSRDWRAAKAWLAVEMRGQK